MTYNSQLSTIITTITCLSPHIPSRFQKHTLLLIEQKPTMVSRLQCIEYPILKEWNGQTDRRTESRTDRIVVETLKTCFRAKVVGKQFQYPHRSHCQSPKRPVPSLQQQQQLRYWKLKKTHSEWADIFSYIRYIYKILHENKSKLIYKKHVRHAGVA